MASRYTAMLKSAPDFDYTFTKVIIAVSVLYSFIGWRYVLSPRNENHGRSSGLGYFKSAEEQDGMTIGPTTRAPLWAFALLGIRSELKPFFYIVCVG